MPVLERPAGAIRYQVTGSGERVLLLTHGYAATSAMFAPNVAALAAAGYRVLTWDLRGHGGSDSPADDPDAYRAPAALADMTALLSAAGAARAVLGGHSLGGYLSLDFTLGHPGQVSGLVLIGTGPGFRNDAARQAWNDRAGATAARLDERGLAALGGPAELHGGQHRDAAGLASAARYTLSQADARVIDGLPRIQVPALVVVGDGDRAFLGAADYMTGKIRGARKVVIAGAGHAPNVDQPAAFNAEAAGFLAGLAAAAEPSS